MYENWLILYLHFDSQTIKRSSDYIDSDDPAQRALLFILPGVLPADWLTFTCGVQSLITVF